MPLPVVEFVASCHRDSIAAERLLVVLRQALGLLVLVIGCAAIIGGQNTSTQDKAGQDSAVEEDDSEKVPAAEPAAKQEADEEETVAIEETVTVGDVQWTVTNARRANELTSQFMEPKRGNFVVVDFIFKNNGNEAVTLDSQSLALLDSEDRKFETDNDTFGYIDPAKDIFLDQVNPGVQQQGEVIFTVADGASGFTLQVGDTNFFSDKNGYVDLGF